MSVGVLRATALQEDFIHGIQEHVTCPGLWGEEACVVTAGHIA